MKVGVLGTGVVGDKIGSRLVGLGHNVMMGSRSATNEKAQAFAAKHSGKASAGTFADAAAFGELIFNCTKGMETLNILNSAGGKNLSGKILIDVTNALDFSKGFPPTLSVCNTSSLGEEIQKAFPDVKVIKALNTMNCDIMVDPASIGGGNHNVFICGNDAGAKAETVKLLESFGWKQQNIIDLGDITSARGTEMILPLWVRLYGGKKHANFNFKIVE
ncbi:MAG: NADPH-dependent F420 reductase [Bacteroidia bacterium]